jgi:hypothetical protein
MSKLSTISYCTIEAVLLLAVEAIHLLLASCRRRILMCRRALPECKRCRQLGVTCGGYGLRLSWVQYNPEDDVDRDLNHTRRELASFDAFTPLKRMLSPELDATLTTLDAWRPESCAEIEDGAFCVFAVQPSVPEHCNRRNRSPSTYQGKLTLLSI